MVDGMGLCGFEGVYRRVMETCMSVLRTNRETLLSVLEPFLQASIVLVAAEEVPDRVFLGVTPVILRARYGHQLLGISVV